MNEEEQTYPIHCLFNFYFVKKRPSHLLNRDTRHCGVEVMSF